jgi:hypothetical protein
MSRNNNNTKQSNKPFCKVCFDAGKTESEYTSHYVRKTTDPNSELLCPVLKATECRYCHQMGHTISRCAVREQNNIRRRPDVASQQAHVVQQQAPSQVAQVPVEVQVKKSNNKYAAFEEDDEEEVLHVQEQAQAHIDETEFPSLLRTSSVSAPVKHVSYAAAFVSTAAPQKWQSRADARRVVEPTYEDDEEEEDFDGAEAILSRFRHEAETKEVYNDNPLLNRDYAYEDW